jgi:hypothetical protein
MEDKKLTIKEFIEQYTKRRDFIAITIKISSDEDV